MGRSKQTSVNQATPIKKKQPKTRILVGDRNDESDGLGGEFTLEGHIASIRSDFYWQSSAGFQDSSAFDIPSNCKAENVEMAPRQLSFWNNSKRNAKRLRRWVIGDSIEENDDRLEIHNLEFSGRNVDYDNDQSKMDDQLQVEREDPLLYKPHVAVILIKQCSNKRVMATREYTKYPKWHILDYDQTPAEIAKDIQENLAMDNRRIFYDFLPIKSHSKAKLFKFARSWIASETKQIKK